MIDKVPDNYVPKHPHVQIKTWVVWTAHHDGSPIAYKLQNEGKKVILAVVDDLKTANAEEGPEERKRRLLNYDGVLTKVDARKLLHSLKNVKGKDSYFHFFDLNSLWKYAQAVKSLGFIHGNFYEKEDLELESDREKAKELVKKHYPGLKVAPTHDFKKVADAIKFLNEPEQRDSFFALKGDSDHGAETVVPVIEDPLLAKRALIEALEKNPQSYEKGGFILETRIPHPIEVTPAAFFYNGELVCMDVDIENKCIGAGESNGYQVGAAQTLICPLHRDSELARIAFPPVVYEMAKKRKGMFNIDASILIDRRDGSMYFGEYCTRPGYDSIFAEIAMSRSAHGFFEDMISGINPLIRDYGVAVRLFNLPKKPSYSGEELGDRKIDWKTDLNLWPWDMKIKDGEKMTVGSMSDVAVATGYGKDIESAVSMAYDASEQLNLKNVYKRPEEDFMGKYKTSIMERYEYIEEMKKPKGLEPKK